MTRLSRTESSVSRVSCCGTTPSRPRIRGPSTAGSSPRIRSSPALTGDTHPTIRIVLVLPAPFGPRKPKLSPVATSKSMPSTAVKSPNFLVSPRAWMSGVGVSSCAMGPRMVPHDPAGFRHVGEPFRHVPGGVGCGAMSVEGQLEALLRLILAGIAGAVIGLEREVEDKPAGIRTFATVAIGSALFTVAPSIAFPESSDSAARVAAQIVTGIGFLGAGTIIQVKDRVEGLTTAAGIWAVAAVGMTFGFGLYVLGTGSTVVLLVLIAVVGRLMPSALRRPASND